MIENSKKFITRKLNIYIPSQNSSSLSSLNAILGQNSINVFDFNKQFNNLSKIYLNDIILNVQVNIYNDKSFSIFIKGPSSIFLIYEQILKKNKDIDSTNDYYIINLSELYKITIFINKLFDKNERFIKKKLKSIFGTIASSKIKIINDL
jgi:ribosomal protein L11